MIDDGLNSYDIPGYEKCDKCPKMVKHRQTIVVGRGLINAPIMVVGLGPGKEEDDAGEPFVGPSGGLLWDMMEEVGIPRKTVYATNAVLCRPAKPRKEPSVFLENRDPTLDEINNCRPRLMYEIAKIDPVIIVALGKVAVRGVTGKDAKKGTMGTVRDIHIKSPAGNIVAYPIIHLFHPAYILRGAPDGEVAQMMESLKFVKKIIDFQKDK
jgi:DNA polymerase